jgi:DNA-binding GntR family transcriptional regulator
VARTVDSGNDHHVPRGPERPSETAAADLRRRIAAGEWAVDEALPTVAALAEHYHVSRSTAARALRTLAAEGLVRIVPRWGTFRAG